MLRKTLFALALTLSCSLCFAQNEAPHTEHDHQHEHLDDPTADTTAVVDTVKVRVTIDGESIVSVADSREMIGGAITPYDPEKKYSIEAIDRTTNRHVKIPVEYDGRFIGRLSIAKGVNYIDVILSEKTKAGTVKIDSAQQILFSHFAPEQTKQAILWIDQFSTAKQIKVDSVAAQLVRQIKDAGFTAIAVEVRGVEGYVSYRKNDLSGTPYLTATKNFNHRSLNQTSVELVDSLASDSLPSDSLAVENFAADSVAVDSIVAEQEQPFDLLGALSGAADTIGVKVYAAFNFFTQGNITTRDTQMIDAHPEWESYVISVGDTTGIMPLRQSSRAREAHDKGNRLQYLYTNPADDNVQRQELARVSEVLKNYPVDGVIIARCRYGGLDADFSEISHAKFVDFLTAKGKQLKNFPDEIISFDRDGGVIEGIYFNDWIEFRSQTIANFVGSVRQVVDSYKSPTRNVELAAYVGGWYDRYFGYGVNWASKNFIYNDRLAFDRPAVYTPAYAATSLLKDLNLLIVGVFDEQVKRDLALCELLVNGELPIVAALRMPEQQDAAVMLHAVESATAGMMIFDLSRLGELTSAAPLITEAMPEVKTDDKIKKKR